NGAAPSVLDTLSLHDALPISDVSRSVDAQKFQLQREGYAAAITNPRVLEAIGAGRHGRVAICYIEWSGAGNQKVVIDWTVIRDRSEEHTSELQSRENLVCRLL